MSRELNAEMKVFELKGDIYQAMPNPLSLRRDVLRYGRPKNCVFSVRIEMRQVTADIPE